MYKSAKILAITTLCVIVVALFRGLNPILALLAVAPQALATVAICFGEYRYKEPIHKFPILIASPALAALLGALLFGVLPFIWTIFTSNNSMDALAFGFASGMSGFIQLGFIGLVAGLIIHASKR